MLAYAAAAPRHSERRSSPNAMLAIIAVHIALVAAVMSARMELPVRAIDSPTKVDLIDDPHPPPPEPAKPRPQPDPSFIDRPTTVVPMPAPVDIVPLDPTPSLPGPDVIDGPSPTPGPAVDPLPLPAPVRTAAELLTPPREIRPPYPSSKLASGEEASLRLRLAIDPSGRVAAVEAVGPADRTFLEAARRHILRHWRYRPATSDGHAISASIVISLRFQLDG